MRIDRGNSTIITHVQKVALHPSFSDKENSSSHDIDSLLRVRSDITVNPVDESGWRKPSPYSAYVVDHRPSMVAVTAQEPGYFEYLCHYDVPFPEVSQYALEQLLPSHSMCEEVLTKALNNLADRKASFAESAAEAIKTAQGLQQNAESISDFLFAASKRDWRGVAKSLGISHRSRKHRKAVKRTVDSGGSLGGAWLNFWFGLAPIVSDMVSVAVFLSDENVHNTLRVNGASQGAYNNSETVDVALMGGELSGPNFVTRTMTRSTSRVRVSLDYSITSQSLRRLATFGAVDIPSTLWAVQPYSFLVDWVLPVSGLLKAYTADSFMEFRGGSLTKSCLVEARHLPFASATASHLTLTSFTAVQGKYMTKMVERTVYKSSPKPTSIRLQDPLGLWKGITSLALLATRLKSSFG